MVGEVVLLKRILYSPNGSIICFYEHLYKLAKTVAFCCYSISICIRLKWKNIAILRIENGTYQLILEGFFFMLALSKMVVVVFRIYTD